MRVIDPGHRYSLTSLDIPKEGAAQEQVIQFVKREGPAYPGNVGTSPGILIQDLLRVCLDRLKYLNKQVPCWQNTTIQMFLRLSLGLLENRTRERRGQPAIEFLGNEEVETELTCEECGHIRCLEEHA